MRRRIVSCSPILIYKEKNWSKCSYDSSWWHISYHYKIVEESNVNFTCRWFTLKWRFGCYWRRHYVTSVSSKLGIVKVNMYTKEDFLVDRDISHVLIISWGRGRWNISVSGIYQDTCNTDISTETNDSVCACLDIVTLGLSESQLHIRNRNIWTILSLLCFFILE